jgi:hypothetical protein
MRRSAAVLVLAVTLAACADPPAPAPAGGDPEPQLDERRLAIYEVLIRELAGAEDLGDGDTWERVVIVSKLCENAAEPFPPEGCDDELSEAEQVELAQRLERVGSTVTFVNDPTPIDDVSAPGSVVVRVGPIAPYGDGVEVGGSYVCGGLCGSGTTYLLEESAGGWEVVGNTGSAWIA